MRSPQNMRIIEWCDSMQEGRGGVDHGLIKYAASLELTAAAGKEQRNCVSQCNAEVCDDCAPLSRQFGSN